MDSPLGLPLSDRAFLLVAAAVLVLLACAVVFTLTAAWLRAWNVRLAKRWERLESVWEPAVLAVLAGESTEPDFHRRVERKDAQFVADFLVRYARRLKGGEREAVFRLAAPYLDTVAAHVRHRSPERRAYALQTLGVLSVARYRGEFLRALDDPSPLVAMNAFQALARHYHPSYAEQLLRALERFQYWSIRYLAAMLATMGNESLEVLRAAYADSGRPHRARAVIAVTLTNLNDARSLDIATRTLESEDQTDLLVASLGLLEKVGGDEQLPTVRRLIRSPDPPVRARAVSALARLGTAEDAEQIRSALDDASNWVALHAAQGLKEMGRDDLLALIEAADHPRAIAAREMLWERER